MYNSTPVTTFLMVYNIKSEESLGVNTKGGISGPELEMLKARGGLD